jgi:hypothetical protein
MRRNRKSTQVNTNTANRRSSSLRDYIRVYLRLSAVGLLALLAGCAQLRWDRLGSDTAALEQDLAQCRRLARAMVMPEIWPSALAAPLLLGRDGRGRPILVQPFPSESDRFLREQEFTRACMERNGYALVPVEEQSRAQQQ